MRRRRRRRHRRPPTSGPTRATRSARSAASSPSTGRCRVALADGAGPGVHRGRRRARLRRRRAGDAHGQDEPARADGPAARPAACSTCGPSTAGCSCRQPDPVDHRPRRRGGSSPTTEPTDRAVGRPRVRLDGVRRRQLATPSCSPRTARRSASAPASRTGVDSARIAADRAGDRAVGGVCASDAFFPFRDGLDVAAAAGDHGGDPARRQRPRRRGHRRRRRARHRHGLHRRAPLPPLTARRSVASAPLGHDLRFARVAEPVASSSCHGPGVRSPRGGADVLVRVLPAQDRRRPAVARPHHRRARAAGARASCR